MKITTKLWLGVVFLALISPLGLLLPEYFKAGNKLEKGGSSLNHAPFPGYDFSSGQPKGLGPLSLSYIFCAIAGIFLAASIVFLLTKVLLKNKDASKK